MRAAVVFFAVCVASLLLAGAVATDSQLVDAMKKEIATLAAAVPSPAASLIVNMQASGALSSSSFPVAQIDDELTNKLKFPADVVAKFKQITYSDSVAFQTFSLTINSQVGMLQEFVGAARNLNNTVDLAFIQVAATGTPVPQTQDVATRKCKHYVVVKHCHTEHHKVNRGFTTGEITVIATALRATAYAHLQQQIANPPKALAMMESSALFTALSEIVAPSSSSEKVLGDDNDTTANNTMLVDLMNKVLAQVPALQQELNSPARAVVVEKIIGGKGFTDFKQKADVQQVNGVKDEYISLFLGNLQQELGLPHAQSTDVSKVFEDILYEKSDTWVVYRIVFSASQGGDCKYVCVMGRHHESLKKTDWLIADVQATFKLAPDVLVLKESKSVAGGLWSSSNEKLVTLPKSLTEYQMATVFDFFEVVAFERFAEILHITSGNNKAKLPANDVVVPIALVDTAVDAVADAAGESKWSMLQSAITNVLDDWTKLVNAVKSSSSSTIMSRIVGQGFDKFEESAQMQQIDSMVDTHLPVFFNELHDRLSIPAANVKDFNYVLDDLQYETGTVWTAFHIVYSMGSGGACKSVTFLAHHNETAKTSDFLLANIGATFDLAPDVFIIRKSKSILGGIWSSTKDVMKKVPRGLNEKDLEAVFDFFEIVAWKKLADLMGIHVNNPSV